MASIYRRDNEDGSKVWRAAIRIKGHPSVCKSFELREDAENWVKEPGEMLHQWLDDQDLILFALDFDEGGKVEYDWWQTTFSQIEPWPVPEEKSPGDYFVKGGNLQTWISSGIDLFLRNGNRNP